MSGPTYDPAEVRLPEPPARVHFVGIGGAGVSGLARIMLGMGYAVSGSDVAPSAETAHLARLGAQVAIGHAAEHVAGAALVVATAAARDDNPELRAARDGGIPVVKRAALLGRLTLERECLAVAGTHGKSTTSGMATLALERAGLSPSFAVGATVRELGTNARVGSGGRFVVEADEYDYSFLWLRPRVAIVTSIEHDHPDLFPDLDAVVDAFVRFVACVIPTGTLVTAADDAGCARLLDRVATAATPQIVTFGERAGDWQFAPRSDGTTEVRGPNGQMFVLRLRVPGRHNQRNALAVCAAAQALGVDPSALVPGLAEFGGVGRRFEVLRDSAARVVIDDYAHHPTEISATIAAARERYPGRRLVVIFQPHTYSRTLALRDAFAAALDAADEVVLAEIYPSRETDTLGVSSGDIARRMVRSPVVVSSPDDAAEWGEQRAKAGDVLLVMGAGDITRAARILAGGAP